MSMFVRGGVRFNIRKYCTSVPKHARILASDSIEKVCGDVFRARGHELVEKPGISKADLLKVIGEFDGLVVRSNTKVTKEVIEAGINLKLIGRAGTGVDNIDCRSATSKGVLVVNTPGGNTISTAELCVAHILGIARNISQATSSLKANRWDRSKYTGIELYGKTLGIVGMGRIGREVASRCQGLGMQVIGYDPVLSENAARNFGVSPVSLDELFAKSDFITLHTPMTKDTHNIINKNNLLKCKKGVRIVNCARGGLINEADLLEAIQSGHVAGACLDVLEEEPPVADSETLRMHPNVVMTPHLGASTSDAQTRVAKQVAENMCDILDGGEYRGVVNAPDLGAINKLPNMKPFVHLAEKLGSIHAQLLGGGKVNSVNITLRGKEVADSSISDILKSAMLKGMLGSLSEATNVSYVNAISIAQDMGLGVTMNMSEKTMPQSGYTNTITVDVELEGFLNMTRSIEGTIFGENDVRITEIDGFEISIPDGENVLVFNNVDQPGVIHNVTKKLADLNIDVSHFSLARKNNAKKAMCILLLSSPVPAEVMPTFGKDIGLSNVMQLSFEKNEDPLFRVRNSNSSDADGKIKKPSKKPSNPEFSSGPCKKRPGYSLSNLRTDVLGRSHRSKLGKGRIVKAMEDTKRILGVPSDYFCGIVPASDTGAMEMSMWSMLGPKPVDVCHWEAFGKGWFEDISKHLKIPQVREISAPYGSLPDLSQTNPDHDIVFTFNGTTSGVRVPNLDWISSDRTGLTFNDATSAAFAMEIDWSKADVTTFSWQKVLGGEGAHGVLILSPRAVSRLESFKSDRALPKIFRMTKADKTGKITFEKAIFNGDTINTPSMLCVEDYIDALEWADSIGGLPGLKQRTLNNLSVMEKFVSENSWISFLANDPSFRSSTSVCFTLKLTQPQVKKFVSLLEAEGVAYDIGSYRDAPDGLRIWCGATVCTEDLEALLPWLKWAYETCQIEQPSK